jgi:hypothetical protein
MASSSVFVLFLVLVLACVASCDPTAPCFDESLSNQPCSYGPISIVPTPTLFNNCSTSAYVTFTELINTAKQSPISVTNAVKTVKSTIGGAVFLRNYVMNALGIGMGGIKCASHGALYVEAFVTTPSTTTPSSSTTTCVRRQFVSVIGDPIVFPLARCVALCPKGVDKCRGNLDVCAVELGPGYAVAVVAKVGISRLTVALNYLSWFETKRTLVVEGWDYPICAGGVTDGVSLLTLVAIQVDPATNRVDVVIPSGAKLCDTKIGQGDSGCQTSSSPFLVTSFTRK